MRNLAILSINNDVIKIRAFVMRLVHRHRKFNPKKFTLGQYDYVKYDNYVKSAKRPFKAFQSHDTEQTMYTGQYKRKYYRPNRGRVDDLVRHKKYRHIVEAANVYGKGVKATPFIMSMKEAAQRPERFPTKYVSPRQRHIVIICYGLKEH